MVNVLNGQNSIYYPLSDDLFQTISALQVFGSGLKIRCGLEFEE